MSAKYLNLTRDTSKNIKHNTSSKETTNKLLAIEPRVEADLGASITLAQAGTLRRRKISPYQPFVQFLWVSDVILVWYDRVDQPLSSLNTFAAFTSQESSLSWTVDAYLTVLVR